MCRASWFYSILVACVLGGILGGVREAKAQFTDCSAITGMPQSECQALVDFYDSTNGATWTTKTGWKQTTTPCTWFRVTCSGGHVTQLTPYSNNLVGTIPASIGNLVNLTSLQLYGNQLSGGIPTEIGYLTNLTYLHLENASLGGSIPESICNLTKLGQLRLRMSSLTGSIPACIGNLTNLVILWLSTNELTGTIPASIGNLSKLENLFLASNKLSGEIPSEIGNLGLLKDLQLQSNKLSGSIPTSIGNLTNLTSLGLGANQLSGSIPSSIGNLTKLTGLGLYNNQLSGSIPASIGNLTKLPSLDISFNQLSGTIPTSVGNLTELTSLYLHGNQLSGTIPTEIGNLTKLTALNISSNQLTGNIPLEIGSLSALTSLQLSSNQLSASIPVSIGNLVNLTSFRLNSNQLTGVIPTEIGNLTKLQTLNFNSNQLTGAIPNSIGNLTNLVYLFIEYNQLSGNIPKEIGNLVNLSYLQLSNNQLTGNIPSEIGNLTKLNYLVLNTNYLGGQIPSSIGNMTSLVGLYLHTNNLTGSIPPEITNLSLLSILELHYNQLTGNLPEGIGNLEWLTDFQIQRNQLTGELPIELVNKRLLQFGWYKNHFLIGVSGRIANSNNEGIGGVTVLVTGFHQTSAITDKDGRYLVKIPDGYAYTLTPSKAGHIFQAVNRIGTIDAELIGGLELTGQDFTGYYDTDGDGLNDLEEAAHGTNPHDSDSDDDGVSDSEEIAKGTNPLDRGSAEATPPKTLCAEWNGFLGMDNVLEHMNLATSGRKFTTTLYSLAGQAEAPVGFSIAGGGEYDLLVHDLSGFENNRYGQVCSTATNGQAGDLEGRMVFYKPDSATGRYQFAFAMPLGDGRTGTQYVPYNTYQPSLDPVDSGNLAANWIQLTNLSTVKQTGELVFYDRDGKESARQDVTLKAGARFDFSAHDIAGIKQVGLVEWLPTVNDARFQLRNVRYYYRAGGEQVPLGDAFDSAFQLEGVVGSGQLLAVPLDTAGSSAVLELANTLAEEVSAEVTIYPASGGATGGEALHHQTYKLKPHATYHLIVDSLLNGATGIATIQGSKPASVIATAMEYGRTATLGIQTVYGIQASEARGTVMHGSYNTYLKQDCRLLMVNPTSSEAVTTVSMTRYDGTSVNLGQILSVPAHGLTDYDLCEQDQENVYGVVTVQPATPNTIFATVLRIGENDQYRFPTPVRQ